MKTTLVTVVALAVAFMAGPSFAAELIADGGDPLTAMDVGEVTITNDATNLIVTMTIDTGDWEFVESHVHAADTAADIPQTKNGNAKPGKFDYSELDPEANIVSPTQHVYTIPLAAIGDGVAPGDSIVVAVHAAIEYVEVVGVPDDAAGLLLEDPPDILHEETAWGDGPEIGPGRDWAMYINYTIPIPD